MSRRFAFDRAYYERHYRDRSTRVGGLGAIMRLGGFVAAYLRYLEQPVATVVDFGCGLGHWQRVVRRHFPAARYTGVELSRYLCAQYGWTRGSVVDWVADELLRLSIGTTGSRRGDGKTKGLGGARAERLANDDPELLAGVAPDRAQELSNPLRIRQGRSAL